MSLESISQTSSSWEVSLVFFGGEAELCADFDELSDIQMGWHPVYNGISQ